MKKFLALAMAMIILISLSACGQGVIISNNENSNDAVVIQQEEKKEEKKFEVGEKITIGNIELIINSVDITYDVLPDDTSGFYTHYEADAGKVYISVDVDVVNKGKQNLPCDEIGKMIADYNNGYRYSGFVVVKDDTTGFTYANITSIDPLETQGIKWLIECPEEVGESSNPLHIELSINGEKLIHTIR